MLVAFTVGSGDLAVIEVQRGDMLFAGDGGGFWREECGMRHHHGGDGTARMMIRAEGGGVEDAMYVGSGGG